MHLHLSKLSKQTVMSQTREEKKQTNTEKCSITSAFQIIRHFKLDYDIIISQLIFSFPLAIATVKYIQYSPQLKGI